MDNGILCWIKFVEWINTIFERVTVETSTRYLRSFDATVFGLRWLATDLHRNLSRVGTWWRIGLRSYLTWQRVVRKCMQIGAVFRFWRAQPSRDRDSRGRKGWIMCVERIEEGFWNLGDIGWFWIWLLDWWNVFDGILEYWEESFDIFKFM